MRVVPGRDLDGERRGGRGRHEHGDIGGSAPRGLVALRAERDDRRRGADDRDGRALGSLAWAVAEVSAEEIDKSNILKASFLAMHRALDQLKLRPEFLLIDGNRFVAYQELPHECVVKGDGKFLSIAAASVLAKNYRDDLMAGLGEEFPHYGWASNAGYPTTAHRQAIREHGPSKWHRMSFKLLPDPTLFD